MSVPQAKEEAVVGESSAALASVVSESKDEEATKMSDEECECNVHALEYHLARLAQEFCATVFLLQVLQTTNEKHCIIC